MTFLYYDGLTVMAVHGIITSIVVETGSQIAIPGTGLRPGAMLRDLLDQLGVVLEYDEEEALWFTPTIPGLWFGIERPGGPDEPPSVAEVWRIQDPERARIHRVFVQKPVD
ncbi:hypothetical protein [Actinomarinicola tropica]|uniref:Uncharacterized protein n=1 Tax=Actinomarinicola tropica TaxID=2789776 RepID=A0A5Q2RQ50_9ACTN|nr:hypothetical protein [Actinomarinicola tropica]QGG96020.1 hypothetical protein GH723_13445 [Actinomarinicola tropica]